MNKEKNREDEKISRSIKKELVNILKNRGYDARIDHSLKDGTGEEYNIDVYARYEGPLHKDNIVIKCEINGSEIDQNPILELDEVIKNTEANKGIVISPSGFQNKAKKIAKERGIELLDKTRLPQLSTFIPKTGPRFIQVIKESIELNIYYSVLGECKINHLFSLNYVDRPKGTAIKKSFEKNNIFLSNDAKIFKYKENKSVVIDLNKIYFIKHSVNDHEEYELNIYTYMGVNLEDVEVELDYKITNRGKKALDDLNLETCLISPAKEKLEKIDSNIKKDNGFLNSKSYLDSTYLFSLDISEYNEYLEEGTIADKIRNAFEKNGYDIDKEAKLLHENEKWFLIEDRTKKYLIKEDNEKIKVYDLDIHKTLKILHPKDSVDYSVEISLPLWFFVKHLKNFGLNSKLRENGKIIDSKYFDLSSSEDFKNGFIYDLRDLENSLKSETKKSETTKHKGRRGCFIATAVYGDPGAEKIDILRSFRDEILLEKRIGKALTNLYYKVSPGIANRIAKDESLRKAVGHLVVYPITDIAKKVLDSK